MLFLIDILSLFIPPLAGFFASLYSRFWAPERRYVGYSVEMLAQGDADEHESAVRVTMRARGTKNIHATRAYVYASGEGTITSCRIEDSDRVGRKARSFNANVDSTNPQRAVVEIPLLYPNEILRLSLRFEGQIGDCWVETPDDPLLAEPLSMTKWAERINTVGVLAVFAMWGIAGFLIYQGATLKWVGWGVVSVSFLLLMLIGAIAPEEEERKRQRASRASERQRRVAERKASRQQSTLPDAPSLESRLSRVNAVLFVLVLTLWAVAGFFIHEGGWYKWLGWWLVAVGFSAMLIAWGGSKEAAESISPQSQDSALGDVFDDR